MSKTTLGDRMKNNYEVRTRHYLTRRTPTLIRLDGQAFHTYTKDLNRPFDEGLMEDMVETTKYLCQNIQGAKCGYTQSDEITLLLTDFDTFETQAWFDYQVQKIVSISASMATAKFNQLRAARYIRMESPFPVTDKITDWQPPCTRINLAHFDSRVFQIPEFEEVVNCFIWRQRDAIKNSISMLAQSLYSPNQLFKKNDTDQLQMCKDRGYDWHELPLDKQRGSFIEKQSTTHPNVTGGFFTRNHWEAVPTPLFGEERESIIKLLYPQI